MKINPQLFEEHPNFYNSSQSTAWCERCKPHVAPQGAVLTKLTSKHLVQMSLWLLESHRQTCLSYPQVRNWGFQGWTAKPHSSSV